MKATGVAGATTFGTSMAAAQEDLPTVTADLADDQIGVGDTTTVTVAVEGMTDEQLEEAGGANVTIAVDPDFAAITEVSDHPLSSTYNSNIEDDHGGAADSFELGTFGGISNGDVIGTWHIEGQADGEIDIELEAFALTGSGVDVREANYDTPTLTIGDGGGTDPGSGTPNVPTDLSVVEATESTITVEWSGDANADSHRVYLDGGSEPVEETTSNSAVIDGLEPDTIYEIGVSAVGGGEETNTTTIEASTDSTGEPPEPVVTTNIDDEEIDVGDTTTVDLGLTSAPNGLTTFAIELHFNSDVVSVADAAIDDAYPGADDMFGQVDIEDDYVLLKAAEDPVLEEPGATNMHFGSIELEGVEDGSADLDTQIEILQDEDDYDIDADIESATLTVGSEVPPPPETVTLDLADDQIEAGETTTADIGLTSAPDGLTTFAVELHFDSSIVSAADASIADGYPGADDMFGQVEIEDDYVLLKAAEDPVLEEPGATDLHFGSVELEGEADGTTDLDLEIEILQDEDDYDIDADTESASLTVDGEVPPPGTTVTLDVDDDQIETGETTTADIGLTEAPDGLTTFAVELHFDSNIVSASDASIADGYPGADDMFGQVEIEDDYVLLKAAEDPVLEEPGATNLHFGQVELEGEASGTTDLDLEIEILQDEDDYDIDADTESASLTVDGEVPPPGTTVTLDVDDDQIETGETTTADIGLTEAPDGLTTFAVELHFDSSVVSAADASIADGYPGADDMFGQVEIEDDYVLLKAAEDPVLEEPGATDLHFGQVELQGEAGGTTDLDLEIEILQDEDDYDIDADTESASLTVDGEVPPPGTTVTLDLGADQIDVGDTTTADIGLTSAPDGLTTFAVELHFDSNIVSAADASINSAYPGADDMFGQVEIEDDYVLLKAAEDPVLEEPGATDLHFGQVVLEGEADGSTTLDVQIEILQDEDDYDIDADTESASLTVEGDGPTPPSMPQNLSVDSTDTSSISLSWSPDANADSYNVYVNGDLETDTTSSNATITGLDEGTEYEIGVSAVGAGEESSTATVTAETEIGGGGTWDPNELYQRGETVEYNGETWEAKWTNQGQEPEFDVNGAWEPLTTEIPLQQDLAAIQATSTSVGTGERVAFSVQDTSSNQAWITDLEMDFGDGTTASGWWNAHTYDSPGTYTVTLTATDQRGRQSTDEVTINVS